MQHQGKPTLVTAFFSEQSTAQAIPPAQTAEGRAGWSPLTGATQGFTLYINCICYSGRTEVTSQLQHGFNSPFSFLVNCWELSLTLMELQLHKFTAEQAPNVTEDSIQTYLQVYPFGK